MIATCSRCPRQLCCLAQRLDGMLQAFGWRRHAGKFLCHACAQACPMLAETV